MFALRFAIIRIIAAGSPFSLFSPPLRYLFRKTYVIICVAQQSRYIQMIDIFVLGSNKSQKNLNFLNFQKFENFFNYPIIQNAQPKTLNEFVTWLAQSFPEHVASRQLSSLSPWDMKTSYNCSRQDYIRILQKTARSMWLLSVEWLWWKYDGKIFLLLKLLKLFALLRLLLLWVLVGAHRWEVRILFCRIHW